MADPKEADRTATEKVSPEVAWGLWGAHALGGLAFGILEPSRVRTMLEIEYAPEDPERWKRTDDAGLVPPEREDMSLDDEIDRILEMTRNFVEASYPELLELLAW